jgi:hypothetical protein
MTAFQFVLVIALVALTARSQQNSPQEPSAQPQPVPPASCPITRRPAREFIPPVPYDRDENSFWLGTEKLWTFLPERVIWEWAPHQPGHEQRSPAFNSKNLLDAFGLRFACGTAPCNKGHGETARRARSAPPGVAADQRLSRAWFCHADRCVFTHSRLLGDHGRLPSQ